MASKKAIILSTILFAFYSASLVSAEVDTFKFEVGTGRRDGFAQISVQPDLDAKRTFLDFKSRQLGVGANNRLRIAVQWLRHSNSKNESEQIYEGALFELKVPEYGERADPALEKVLVAKPFLEYRDEGGTLDINEYLNLILLDNDQQVTTYSGSFGYIVSDTSVITGDFTSSTLSFSAPNMDPIGESRVWYKWVFYNTEEECESKDHTCLANSPIDGNDQPYFYTTYFSWTDFYKLGDVYTFMWMMFATSFFGFFGVPASMVFGLCFQGFMLIVGIIGYQAAEQYENFEEYDAEIGNLLMLSLAICNITSNLFTLYTTLPLAGPLMNGLLIWYIPTELQRLAIPLKFTLEDMY